MKRNNSKRLGDLDSSSGAAPGDAAAAAANTMSSNSDLSFVVATDVVDLPSEGRFYPEGHPLHEVETIELKQMTAKEEDILTNMALVRNGTALDRVLNSLLIDKSIQLDSLLVGDKNALLIAARIGAYGANYGAKITCPACNTNSEFSFDLNSLNRIGPDNLALTIDDVEVTENNTLMITVPKTGAVFEMRPRIGADDTALAEQEKRYKKLKINRKNTLTDNFIMVTLSVNGNQDPAHIRRVYENLPAFDFRHIRKVYQDCMPNLDMRSIFECTACGTEEVVSVPMNADFFWPDLRV